MRTTSEELPVMIYAARAAGDLLMELAQELPTLSPREKAASDFVSEADLRSQARIVEVLRAAFPTHALVLEEADVATPATAQTRFLVDPLDGTTNFLHGIPHFAVNIALEREGEIMAGVTYDPAKQELWTVSRGDGAWCNDRKLPMLRPRPLGASILATGIPHRGGRHHAAYARALESLMPQVAGIRRCGAAALDLAYLASGRFDAFFELGLGPWDVATGFLLLQEVGGLFSRVDGSPVHLRDGEILATSHRELHRVMVEHLSPLHADARRG